MRAEDISIERDMHDERAVPVPVFDPWYSDTPEVGRRVTINDVFGTDYGSVSSMVPHSASMAALHLINECGAKMTDKVCVFAPKLGKTRRNFVDLTYHGHIYRVIRGGVYVKKWSEL